MSDLTLKDVAAALERSAELEKRYLELMAESNAVSSALNDLSEQRNALAALIATFLVNKVPTLSAVMQMAISDARREQREVAKERQ